MSSLNNFVIVVVAFFVVFLESTFSALRILAGVQVDLLPSLMVYVSLSQGLIMLGVVSVFSGLCYDSMSANPLGISIIPLFAVGLMVQRYRGLILRDNPVTQFLLGLLASGTVPVLTLLLLWNVERRPLLGWGSLWQWVIMTLIGAAVTPLWFQFFDRLSHAVNYRDVGETTFRANREIKRGRS